ncbi:MAG: glycosyltransferase family 4 protein [Planctomycetota bacterium]
MRILALTDSLADTDGVGRYCIRLLGGIEKLRSNISIEIALARKHPGLSDAVPKSWRVKLCLPPDYYYYVSTARFYAYTAWALSQLIPAARRADVVHAIKDFPHCYLAHLAARAAGKPCVMTAHGTYAVLPLADPRHSARARNCYPQFKKILCVSEYTKKRITEKIQVNNLEVIKNAVDASHYAPRPRLAGMPWSGARYTAGMGALKERKGHHLAIAGFLKIANAFPELKHFVVGMYQKGDPYFEAIREKIRNAGCEERVVFLGNIKENEKVDLLLGAEALVHTPVIAADGGFEGFGIVYLEAAASGVPSIGTKASGAEDAVVEGVTGYLVDINEDAVAAALSRILSDRPLRERLRNSCIAYAKEQTWEKNARRVLSIYDEILND